MKIKKFNESIVNENVNLYRLVCVPKGEPLVVNTVNPGRFYFQSESEIDPSVLDGKTGDLHVIQIKTTSDNIDESESEIESEAHGCKCVVLKDDTHAEVEKIEPYKKAA